MMQDEHETADSAGVVRLEACVRGRVQGVGFRAFIRDQARRLGVRGSIWNGDDGAVFVVAEGPRPTLEALLAALREGPRLAQPAGIETHWMPATGRAPAPFQVAG
jgi:acylphosphatase